MTHWSQFTSSPSPRIFETFRLSNCNYFRNLFNRLNFYRAIVLSSSLAVAISTQSVVAADGTSCTANECNYSVPLDKQGFYTVAVTLPAGQKEGLYNLLIDPSVPYAQAPFVTHANGFHGGGLLREGGQTPSWVGFSLAQFEPINLTVYNHSNASPLDLILTNSSNQQQKLLKFGTVLTANAQTYTLPALEPGFYTASISGQPSLPKTAYSISIGGNSLFGGVNGGWLDENNVGWGGFYMLQPRTVNLKVQFANSFEILGIVKPIIQIFLENSLIPVWSSEQVATAPDTKPIPEQPVESWYQPQSSFLNLPLPANASWEDTVKSIYTGNQPFQTPIVENGQEVPLDISPKDATIIYGKVVNSLGNALPDVKVTVDGDEHKKYGQALSKSDGSFLLAVNGNAGKLTIKYEKTDPDHIPLQRTVKIDCGQTIVRANIVALISKAEAGGLQLNKNQGSSVEGGVVKDKDGQRQARLFFPPGTQGKVILPDCSEQPLVNPKVSVTEYTQGDDPGVEPDPSTKKEEEQYSSNMPFELPAGTGYTYAVEFKVEEAEKLNAREVKFNQPVMVYVDNFLNFPVGTPVPSGYYDYNLGTWIPSENGYVIKILGSDAAGQPIVDLGGANIVLSDEEKQQIVEWFATTESWYQSKTGHEFWRIPVMHFSPFDFNYPKKDPEDAIPPPKNTPANNDPKDKDDGKDCQAAGCIIEAQSQVLGEVISVAGTPFSLNYRSNRVMGRKAAYTLDIPLRTDDALPKSLKRVKLEIDIAGMRKIEEIFSKDNTPKIYHFAWDGKDDLGRPLPGKHQVKIKIDYLYDAYYQLPTGVAKSFGLSGQGDFKEGSVKVPARQEVARSTSHTMELGSVEVKSIAALGGWTLDAQHIYDPINGVLYEGNGGQRVVEFVPKNSFQAPQPTVIPQTPVPVEPQPEPLPTQMIDLTSGIRTSYCKAQCVSPAACTADCGKILVGAAHIETDAIQWIGATTADILSSSSLSPEILSFIGVSNTLPKNNQWFLQSLEIASISNPQPLNSAPSLGVFFTPKQAGHAEATVVVNAAKSYASGAQTFGAKTVIVSAEGVTDSKENPAIVLDIAWNDKPPIRGDAQAECVLSKGETVFTVTPRLNGTPNVPVQQVAINLLVEEKDTPRCASFEDKVVSANNFDLNNFFFHLPKETASDPCTRKYSFIANVNTPFQFKAVNLSDTQDESHKKGYVQYSFYVSGHMEDTDPAKWNPAEWPGSYKKFHLASKASSSRSGFSSVRAGERESGQSCLSSNSQDFDGRIASRDGGLLYEFKQGKHVRTLDSITGQVVYTLEYNDKGFLTRVIDLDNDVTTIERDANGNPVAIISPYGQRTTLSVDSNGYLSKVSNPAGEAHQMQYTADGLLTHFVDPRNQVAVYEYDRLGLFVKETDAIGGGYSVKQSVAPNGSRVTTLTSKEGRVSTFEVSGDARVNTSPDGTRTVATTQGDTSQVVNSDGTVIQSQETPDERLAGIFASSSAKNTVITTPLRGLRAEISTSTTTNPLPISKDYDPLKLKTLTQKTSVNGRTSFSIFDNTANPKTVTGMSAAGRKTISYLDDKGRVIREHVDGFADTLYAYDARGRLTDVVEGEGVDMRTAKLEYDTLGNISKVTDALGRSVSFTYDTVGRVTGQTLTDGRKIFYQYDANGNVTAIAPPGRTAHGFVYNGEDLQTHYLPPEIGLPTPYTQYFYNQDKQLTKVLRPDSKAIDFVYDTAKGRLNALNTPTGQYVYSYDDKSGNLNTVAAPDGNRLHYAYDGSLPLAVIWEGAVKGILEVAYDNDFRVVGSVVNQNKDTEVHYQYDLDGLLTQAGEMYLIREPQNGLLMGTQLGGKNGIVTQRAYNTFGEMTNETASQAGVGLYNAQYTYDKLGRITQKVEGVAGTNVAYGYEYDAAGRLITVTQNGAVSEQYSYDSNGNRLTANIATKGATTGSYDEQDRLLQYGANTYSYTANGELLSKTSNGTVTQYEYDVLGNLRGVQLPDGRKIEYVIDPSGRRVGKKVNGTLTQGWLYQGSLNPIAELDGNGNLVTRFVYGSKANVPDYFIKAGKTYRILSDHLGSPRLVIDLSTGAVVQRMDYDAFGNVTQDSNPNFQPFGFAGGLYDSETRLVRFGARDYDAETGRWTAKDPINFAGGDTNLYGYVLGDPINITDISGKFIPVIVAGLALTAEAVAGVIIGSTVIGAAIGGLSNIAIQYANGKRFGGEKTIDFYDDIYNSKGELIRTEPVYKTVPNTEMDYYELAKWTGGGAVLGAGISTSILLGPAAWTGLATWMSANPQVTQQIIKNTPEIIEKVNKSCRLDLWG